MPKRTDISSILIIGLLLPASAFATSCPIPKVKPKYGATAEQLEASTVIAQKDGSTLHLIPYATSAGPNESYKVIIVDKNCTQHTLITEFWDGEKVQYDREGVIGCFEIGAVNDEISCTARDNAWAWSNTTYVREGDALRLISQYRMTQDDPDTEENEEKTVMEYKRKL